MNKPEISPHFTFDEATRTEVRGQIEKNRESLLGDEPALDNARRLAMHVLEPIRVLLGRPIIVHSWYRNVILNRIVGGSERSQHQEAAACDFHVSGMNLKEAFEEIWKYKDLHWGQLILEGFPPSWIHISLPIGQKKGQVMSARLNEKGKWEYRLLADRVNFREV